MMTSVLWAVEKPSLHDMISIPSGCFQMGDIDGEDIEVPVHSVCINSFFMDKYEVSQEQYQKIMGHNPSVYATCEGSCPVENVTWEQSYEYCKKVGKRLPTEAEWEYAARAGTKTMWYCGNEVSCFDSIGWAGGWMTHPVGLKKPNAWGLFDMLGNVMEWTDSWYSKYPTLAKSGKARVFRGGYYGASPELARSSIRFKAEPSYKESILGFRCAASSTNKAKVSNKQVSDSGIVSSTPISKPTMGSFTDNRDGRIYQTVVIGS